jgi:hypothetical protein
MLEELSLTERSCLKINKKIYKFSDVDLERFRTDPTHNPITGRPISKKGTIFRQLKHQLDLKDKMIDNNNNNILNIPPKVIVKKLKPKGLATNEQK